MGQECWQYLKIGKWKNEIQFFFCQSHALWTSFDIFVVTYRVSNFLPKLMDILLFSMEKTEFPFFLIPLFSGITRSAKSPSLVFVPLV